MRIGSCRERHRRTRRGSRIVIPRSEATWESRSTRPHRGKAIGKIATACPRLPRAQSALAMTNLLALRHRIRAAKPTACKALNPRKGDAASVRRQSRQRLRRERRYRRNRLVRFYRHLVRTGSAFPRLPRRFAPRNDTSGRRSNGNGAAHRIGGTTAASRTGGACPAPTGPVRIERRPAYDPFFILQYSLFIISSIPLRGMANHMTKRPEIPCLSCKFPQSRRICH